MQIYLRQTPRLTPFSLLPHPSTVPGCGARIAKRYFSPISAQATGSKVQILQAALFSNKDQLPFVLTASTSNHMYESFQSDQEPSSNWRSNSASMLACP